MQQEIKEMQHAIGLDYKKPYKRHGKLFYKPYRNYFCTNPSNKLWQGLVNLGYAQMGEIQKHQDGIDSVCFFVTRRGLDMLGGYMNCKIYDEEN